MYQKKNGSDIQGSWSRSNGTRNLVIFQGIRTGINHLKKDDSLINRQSIVIDTLQYLGFWCLSVCKVKVLAESVEGKHFVITCQLTMNTQKIPTNTLIDCRATGIAFIDADFTCHQQIPLQMQKEK